MTRENVRNARETEHRVLDPLEIDNSSSGELSNVYNRREFLRVERQNR